MKAGLPNGFSMLLANDSSEYIAKELQKIGFRTLFFVANPLVFCIYYYPQFALPGTNYN